MWYSKHMKEVAEELGVTIEAGLSPAEAKERLKQFGPNQLTEGKQKAALIIFLEQFKNPLLIILLGGAAISFYTGHLIDSVAILIIVFINALISFTQESKAQKSLASLKQMSAPRAHVRRGGEWLSLPVSELVPGDVLKVNTGDVVGADIRLVESNRLHIDEAALTGESEPVYKITDAIVGAKVEVGDQKNMAFSSTIVTGGNGLGLVVGTGMQTEVGHIAEMMASTESSKTPLQIRLEFLSKILIAAALSIVAFIVAIGIHHGMDLVEMLNVGISLSVAAIPEGLPTVVTIVLTLGSQRMVKNNALVRRLASVETLGSTSVICSDKTGTLTQNQMQVTYLMSGGEVYEVTGQGFDPEGHILNDDGEAIDVPANSGVTNLLIYSLLCNDAELIEKDGSFSVHGNPTEGALVVAGAKASLSRGILSQQGWNVVKSFPFDSTRKMMTVIVKNPRGEYLVITKGAPDVILANSAGFSWVEGSLDVQGEQIIHDTVDLFGSKALRTLAVSYRPIDKNMLDAEEEELEHELIIAGIHGIIDPPRPEVISAVTRCWSAGIKTVMITGDHAATARAIAEAIGIKRSAKDRVVTGAELSEMSDYDLEEIVESAAVFARVSPEHKLRIVKALEARGHVAAMTGDGVNDAPALRASSIGVAMGVSGTQVAKDASCLVLLDDNFSTIVSAVSEGRRIYDNIKKFIRQALTANVGEVSAILFAFTMSKSDPLLPLTALMILWINLVSDGLPALSLGVDTAESDLMARQPRQKGESFFANYLGQRVVLRGLALGWLTFFMFDFALDRGANMVYAQTIAFATLVFAQLYHVFDARTFSTIFRRNPFGNKALLLAVGGSALLSLGMIYTGFGNTVLGTTPLSLRHLVLVIAVSSLPTFLLSALKEVFKIRWL